MLVLVQCNFNFLFKSWQRDNDQRQSTATIAAIKMLVPTCLKRFNVFSSTQATASQIAPCPCTPPA